MKTNRIAYSAIACGLILPLMTAEAYAGGWRINGFVRGDIGNGNRYERNDGENRFGITKAAVKLSRRQNNFKGVLVAGTKGSYDGTTDGDVNIKAAFVEARDIAGSGVTVSAGVQPLLFGLKPNGYEGDRSIHGSVEYGAGGGLPVARQSGPAIIAKADIGAVNIRGGMFTFRESTSFALHDSGASLNDNYFIQAYAKNLFGSGMYGVMGYESVYVNENARSEPITSIGLGWKWKYMDISAERISMAQDIADTVGNESYTIMELGLKTSTKTKLYIDYSETDRSRVNTLRTGINYRYSDYLEMSLEYSEDRYDTRKDIQSLDFRIAMNF